MLIVPPGLLALQNVQSIDVTRTLGAIASHEVKRSGRHRYEALPVAFMDEADFEGTLVLEQLAAIGKVEEFFDAIDSDDVRLATALMKRAKVDAPTIAKVIKKMEQSDGED